MTKTHQIALMGFLLPVQAGNPVTTAMGNRCWMGEKNET